MSGSSGSGDSGFGFRVDDATLPCRLLVDQPANGAWNMALDEALLDDAAERGIATLRFYQWSPAVLSLGYFQAHDERQAHAESRDCTTIRRHSGGGAILHDRELTYSLALPASAFSHRDPHALYLTVHQSLVELLNEIAASDHIEFSLCPQAITPPGGEEPLLCFQRRAMGDLLVRTPKEGLPPTIDGAHKIVGSSQRKRRGAVLQHGSLLLAASPFAPQLPGIAEATGVEIEHHAIINAWPPRLAKALRVGISPGSPSEELISRAERIAGQKFAQPAWIRKR